MNTPTETPVLDAITSPQEVQTLSQNDLEQLAKELRQEIIATVSCTGGHLAPSLGVVELTLALLHVFNPARDKIVWDVGHQSYAYKILTRGLKRFRTLRQIDGISGFPRRSESPYDHFGVGHSSTSISAALGMAVARDFDGLEDKMLAVIGDGSMTAGLAYEGLNQAGDLNRDLVVVLNDNEMSISKNVGALSSFFSRNLSNHRFMRFKEDLKNWLRQVPRIGDELVNYARRSEDSLKSFFTPGMLFEAFKFNYLGPIDGHNLRHLIRIFQQVRELKGPVLVHTLTTKGKGYEPAEANPTHFHGVGCFEPGTGESAKKPSEAPRKNYSKVFGESLCQLADKDAKVVAITAAMPEGTGLDRFKERFPERFFDVGICEQHAVTFAAGMATQGYRPVVCIYSTFLQRSYDQIVHDVCLQNLPVIFCLDRAGLVGEDGPTHHGSFDLSYLRHIPHMTLMAPKDEPELQSMLFAALKAAGPCAIRYPRGFGPGLPLLEEPRPVGMGEAETLRSGRDAAVLALGSTVPAALQAAEELAGEGIEVSLVNARFIKPLPRELLHDLARDHDKLVTVEENALAGGFGSAVLECLADAGLLAGVRMRRLGLPDRFLQHGSQEALRSLAGIDADGVKKAVRSLL